jgi:hypothetical protein
MNGNQPLVQGFMIPVNELDFQTSLSDSPRNICSSAREGIIGAPWYTCENIRFKGTVDDVTARVGDTVTIQVGLQALPTLERFEQVIVSVGAWVCYPNTVAGGADASLVVPSMQPPNQFASYDWATSGKPIADAPHVFNNMSYRTGDGFLWQSLTPWVPQAVDFMDQGEHGGHCCIIANASGLFDWTPAASTPVGFQFIANSELHAHIDVCTDLYQGQRNVVIVPSASGGGGRRIPPRIGFLAGAPRQGTSSKATVAVTALQQGDRVDPVLLKALKSGPYAGLALKPASLPPRSLRLARHECKWNGSLSKIVREAEEVIEEALGMETHPFGGGHRVHLGLPAHGLQPLRVEVELDPTEAPGTVHSIAIVQTDASGARGGIRAGIVVT